MAGAGLAGWCTWEYGCTGVLNISGVDLNGPGVDIPNLMPLWPAATLRGTNLTMPALHGRRGNPQYLDETSVDLGLAINGGWNLEAAAIESSGDPLIGLELNLDWLWDNVLSPIASGRGTRPAILTKPSGATFEADVQCRPLLPVDDNEIDPECAKYTLTLTIVSGRFEPSGSS